nr:hypothetical protein 2 [Forsythia suspensa tombusvirus]
MERLFYVKTSEGFAEPPLPSRDPCVALAGFRRKLLTRISKPTPVPLAEVPLWFKGSRRKRIARAVERLTLWGLRKRDRGVIAFPKPEKWWKKSVPRIIQGPTPEYVASCAKFLKPLEHRVFRAIDEVWGATTVMKGLDQDARGLAISEAWGSFSDPVAIGMDASRFDQHVSKPMLRFEHSVYDAVYGSKELRDLLKCQLEYQGRMYLPDGVIRYKMVGKRRSGDLNTSLGNILIMCAMCHTYVTELGLRPGKDVRLVNDGDDCVFVMERKFENVFCAGLADWFRALGFTMVVEEPAYELERLEFCQSRMVCVDGLWRMVRNPGKALQQDQQLVKHSNFNVVEWAKAVGLCGLHVSRGVPMLQAFYEVMAQGATTSSVLSHADFRREAVASLSGGKIASKAVDIAPSTRVSFWRAYGVDPSTQRIYEQLIAGAHLDFSTARLSVRPGPGEHALSTATHALLSVLFNNAESKYLAI